MDVKTTSCAYKSPVNTMLFGPQLNVFWTLWTSDCCVLTEWLGNNWIRVFSLAYCVAAHNYLRSVHGVPPLRAHDSLENQSQAWATHLAKRAKGIKHYPPNEYFSENIHRFIGTDRRCGVLNAIVSWYVFSKASRMKNCLLNNYCAHHCGTCLCFRQYPIQITCF